MALVSVSVSLDFHFTRRSVVVVNESVPQTYLKHPLFFFPFSSRWSWKDGRSSLHLQPFSPSLGFTAPRVFGFRFSSVVSRFTGWPHSLSLTFSLTKLVFPPVVSNLASYIVFLPGIKPSFFIVSASLVDSHVLAVKKQL